MATYDLTTGVPSEIVAGDILNAPYSGSVLQMLLPAGKFKLETWGAQGGSYSDSLVGGNGGYACGTLTLNASVTIFIRTGGKGGSVTSGATAGSGGFNGGGAGGTGAVSNGVAGSGGGGCSDVRVGTDDVDHSLLCAGGGGGSSFALSASATVPSGYQLGAEYYLADTVTKNGNESITLPTTGATNTGVPGNGYVRITVLEVKPKVGAPVDLRAVSVWYDSISIAWDAGENAVGYKVSRNGVLVSDQTALTYTDFNVAYLTSYTYSVLSYNADGEESAPVSITVRTSYPPPPKPTGFHVIGGVQTAIILAWNASPEEVTFSLKRDGVEVYRGGKLTYTDSGLTKGTEYRYTLTAITQYGETSTDAFMAATKTAIERITDRTAQDVAARRPKGHYNALDLIRVGEAVLYVQSILNGKTGFNISVSAKTDWQLDDIPTRAQLNTYLENIRRIHSIVQEYLTTATIPGNMDSLTWKEANAIESILIDAETLMHDIMLSNHNYSGRTISGVLTLP